MSTTRNGSVAKKSCTRCSTQKRRCDRAIPQCGLCSRLRQPCTYGSIPSSGPTPSLSPRPDVSPGLVVSTPGQLKDFIIRRLRRQLPLAWDAASLDIVLFSLSIMLLQAEPPSSTGNEACDFKELYLFIKGSIASTEALGINSLLVVQSRIMVTLFEVAHGFYPAAYISIGATVRAANALRTYPGTDSSTLHQDGKDKREELSLTWGGIMVLDR
ncbi:hypothetical protein LSUE1_G000521 [Lachnellula suecica]|uniref:Zn(2)-C6 fungal-type domain-containing protein n=1 Tax=Lachnellula suecica TaxID=602035 RepID=A0A8T9CLG5_9HELO|nr:hypothetical protein LSUE1_G000521 [Lachnellula suecica]